MGWGRGESLRGWGGDGDKTCGDGVGMGKTYLLRGGDGDEIVYPRHSLLITHRTTIEQNGLQPLAKWRPFKVDDKTPRVHSINGIFM